MSAKLIDLTGRRFGALSVIRKASKAEELYGRPSWLCRCDCGTECIVPGDFLRNGRRTSCGCRAGVSSKTRGAVRETLHLDIAGQTWGELTALYRVGNDRWMWECSCGRHKAIRASAVMTGRVVSCGHILSETAKRKADEQNVFGWVDGTALATIGGIVRGTVRSTNTSGATGVKVRKYKSGRTVYNARIVFRGREINLGTYPTFEEVK